MRPTCASHHVSKVAYESVVLDIKKDIHIAKSSSRETTLGLLVFERPSVLQYLKRHFCEAGRLQEVNLFFNRVTALSIELFILNRAVHCVLLFVSGLLV